MSTFRDIYWGLSEKERAFIRKVLAAFAKGSYILTEEKPYQRIVIGEAIPAWLCELIESVPVEGWVAEKIRTDPTYGDALDFLAQLFVELFEMNRMDGDERLLASIRKSMDTTSQTLHCRATPDGVAITDEEERAYLDLYHLAESIAIRAMNRIYSFREAVVTWLLEEPVPAPVAVEAAAAAAPEAPAAVEEAAAAPLFLAPGLAEQAPATVTRSTKPVPVKTEEEDKIVQQMWKAEQRERDLRKEIRNLTRSGRHDLGAPLGTPRPRPRK